MEAEISYYRRRAAEEAEAAAAAIDAQVRQIHLELRRQYDRRIAILEAQMRRAQIHVVDAA
jgi:uncharacterized membrane protein